MSEVDPLSALAAAAAGVPEHEGGLGQMMMESPRGKKCSHAAASSSSPLEASEPLCWGAQLRGDPSFCTPGFSGGTAHFKNKFCPACKAGSFEIHVSHIRALPRSWNPESASLDLKLSLSNGHSVGFWKTLPDGEGRFRFVNNTLDCAGPQLVVFRELPSPMLSWGHLPERWVENNIVTLQVAKGTLVPRVPMTALEPELWRGGGGRVSLSAGVFSADGRGNSASAPTNHQREGENNRVSVTSAPHWGGRVACGRGLHAPPPPPLHPPRPSPPPRPPRTLPIHKSLLDSLCVAAERGRAGVEWRPPNAAPPAAFCAPGMPGAPGAPQWFVPADGGAGMQPVAVDANGNAMMQRIVLPNGAQAIVDPNAAMHQHPMYSAVRPMHGPPGMVPVAAPNAVGGPATVAQAAMPPQQCAQPGGQMVPLPADAPHVVVTEQLIGTYEQARRLLQMLLQRGDQNERAMLEGQLNDVCRNIAQLRAVVPTGNGAVPTQAVSAPTQAAVAPVPATATVTATAAQAQSADTHTPTTALAAGPGAPQAATLTSTETEVVDVKPGAMMMAPQYMAVNSASGSVAAPPGSYTPTAEAGALWQMAGCAAMPQMAGAPTLQPFPAPFQPPPTRGVTQQSVPASLEC